MDYKDWNEKKEEQADDLRKKAAAKQGLADTPEEQRKLQDEDKKDNSE